MRARPTLISIALATLLGGTAIASCGGAQKVSDSSSTSAAAASNTSAGDTVPSTPKPTKPTVSIPASVPTTLKVTDLTVGTGPQAEDGSTVVLHYVGMMSSDGTEFDNNYDGDPMGVVLGSGGVIPGWEKGLIGVQAGTRRQLDIPNDLAYGNTSRGDVIKAGDALTFVVDVLAVAPPVSTEQEPFTSVAASASPADQVASVDLVDGNGAEWVNGQHGLANILVFRADTGALIQSTYKAGAQDLVLGELLPGLNEGLQGMKVGGRRQITMPYASAYGDQGNDRLGLPAKTDVVMVIDLVAVY